MCYVTAAIRTIYIYIWCRTYVPVWYINSVLMAVQLMVPHQTSPRIMFVYSNNASHASTLIAVLHSLTMIMLDEGHAMMMEDYLTMKQKKAVSLVLQWHLSVNATL